MSKGQQPARFESNVRPRKKLASVGAVTETAIVRIAMTRISSISVNALAELRRTKSEEAEIRIGTFGKRDNHWKLIIEKWSLVIERGPRLAGSSGQ
jgi:hypothetical protein